MSLWKQAASTAPVFIVKRADRAAQAVASGAIVYLCNGHDYGCASDATSLTGIEHISVTHSSSGNYPFFTIPREDLTPQNVEGRAMTSVPKAHAADAARSFKRHQATLGDWKTEDLLMGWRRLYEFPPGTPEFTGSLTIGNIAEFIMEHAVEIE